VPPQPRGWGGRWHAAAKLEGSAATRKAARAKDLAELNGDCGTDQAELIAHCKTYLSSFKVPKYFRDQMPISSFGKILRRDVRKLYWEHQEVKV
jgi:acyl-CoA synthetase (AMP-forming)/AMP-acid ligase II